MFTAMRQGKACLPGTVTPSSPEPSAVNPSFSLAPNRFFQYPFPCKFLTCMLSWSYTGEIFFVQGGMIMTRKLSKSTIIVLAAALLWGIYLLIFHKPVTDMMTFLFGVPFSFFHKWFLFPMINFWFFAAVICLLKDFGALSVSLDRRRIFLIPVLVFFVLELLLCVDNIGGIPFIQGSVVRLNLVVWLSQSPVFGLMGILFALGLHRKNPSADSTL